MTLYVAYCDASRHFLAARRPLAIIGLQLKSAPGAKEIKLCYAILLHTLSREQVFYYLQSWLKLNLHKKKTGKFERKQTIRPQLPPSIRIFQLDSIFFQLSLGQFRSIVPPILSIVSVTRCEMDSFF